MYKLQKLKNGVRLITIPMSATQTFTILVMVAAGSRHEDKENNGISHFLEHMFFKGTNKRPDTLAISSELDKIGGEYNAFTSKEYTGYYAKVDSRNAGTAINVIGDIFHNSKFDSREIEKEKGVILEEINMYENNPFIHIDDLFEGCLYGDTPAGWDTIGTKENIKKFKRKDFIDYLNSKYQGKDIVVCLAGNFQKGDIGLAKRLFSKKEAGEKNEVYKYTETQGGPRVKIKKQKVNQVSLSLGAGAYSYYEKNYYAAKVLGVILGGSMSSRLFIKIRERGLAYQAHTEVEAYNDSGYLTTVAGTSYDKVGRVIKTILNEYKKIKSAGVGNEELKKAKDYIKGKTILRLESSAETASWITRREILNQKILTPEDYFKIIDKIKPGDLKMVAEEIFNTNNLNLAIIGENFQENKLKPLLKI
ncbi:MAG: pitrilysin family protein [Patescibacteria group bacterium]|jgi:predicted Zn-dependent peptidase